MDMTTVETGRAARRIVTRHRIQHDELEDVETLVDGERATAKRVTTQTPLDRYVRRGLIDRRQHDAGQAFARDWHYARMEPRMIASYRDLIQGGGAPDAAADREHARKRLMRAIEMVGRVASSEVVGVCGLQRPAGGPVAMEIFRRGLDVLADHYGL